MQLPLIFLTIICLPLVPALEINEERILNEETEYIELLTTHVRDKVLKESEYTANQLKIYRIVRLPNFAFEFYYGVDHRPGDGSAIDLKVEVGKNLSIGAIDMQSSGMSMFPDLRTPPKKATIFEDKEVVADGQHSILYYPIRETEGFGPNVFNSDLIQREYAHALANSTSIPEETIAIAKDLKDLFLLSRLFTIYKGDHLQVLRTGKEIGGKHMAGFLSTAVKQEYLWLEDDDGNPDGTEELEALLKQMCKECIGNDLPGGTFHDPAYREQIHSLLINRAESSP